MPGQESHVASNFLSKIKASLPITVKTLEILRLGAQEPSITEECL